MGRLKKLAGLGQKADQSTGQEVVSREEALSAEAGGVEPFEIESRSKADVAAPLHPDPAPAVPTTGGGSGMVEAPAEPAHDPFGVSDQANAAEDSLELDDDALEALSEDEEGGTPDPFAVAPRGRAGARPSSCRRTGR